MNNTNSPKRRKRVAAATAMVLIAGLLGGTFAWNNYSQHKTNDASLDGLYYKATLVEEYDRTQAKDWRTLDTKLTKKISVLNPGNTEAEDDREYGDIYTRIQLKEFMEFRPIVQQYTDERYMIDTDGQFICFYPDPNYEYEIKAGQDGWPVVTLTIISEAPPEEPVESAADTTSDPTPDPAPDPDPVPDVFKGNGKEAAEEYARLIGEKANNGDHEVARQRVFFTPFKTNLVANNVDSINAWLTRYNKVNKTSITLADITVDGAGEILSNDSKYLPSDLIDPEEGLDDAELPWYVKTKENDPNGVYGNFMVIDGQIDETKIHNLLIDEDGDGNADFLNEKIPERADEDQKKSPEGLHDEWIDTSVDIDYVLPQVNGEGEYTAHRWIDGQRKWEVNGPKNPSYFDYIGWIFGEQVVMLSDWDGKPVDKWIIDNSQTNTEGWVYWGNFLAPGEQTDTFLEALTLLVPSDDRAYYALHADMQAVSYDELNRWAQDNDPSGNDKIVEALLQAPLTVSTVKINEQPEEIARGTSFPFTATVEGSNGVNKDVEWTIVNEHGTLTSIHPMGILTVDANETAQTLTIRATSKRDDSKRAEWTVKLVTKPIVDDLFIEPNAADIENGRSAEFRVNISYLAGAALNTGVTWNLEAGNPNIITITPDPDNSERVTVSVNGGPADLGQSFRLVAVANDPDKNGQYKKAKVDVNILPPVDPPTEG